VIEIEQPVYLRSRNAKLSGEIALASLGFHDRAMKLKLCRHDRWEPDKAVAAAEGRWCRNSLARANSALQRRGDGIGGANECVSRVLAESGDLRQIRRTYKDRSVIIW
jgi:hypothetical protein